MELKDLKKHLVEELNIIGEVLHVGNTNDRSADWFQAKILAAQILIDALCDELTPDSKETEDDF